MRELIAIAYFVFLSAITLLLTFSIQAVADIHSAFLGIIIWAAVLSVGLWCCKYIRSFPPIRKLIREE